MSDGIRDCGTPAEQLIPNEENWAILKRRVQRQSDEMDGLRAEIAKLKNREYTLLQANDQLRERLKVCKKAAQMAHIALGMMQGGRV